VFRWDTDGYAEREKLRLVHIKHRMAGICHAEGGDIHKLLGCSPGSSTFKNQVPVDNSDVLPAYFSALEVIY